jgi:hypothetical protein
MVEGKLATVSERAAESLKPPSAFIVMFTLGVAGACAGK